MDNSPIIVEQIYSKSIDQVWEAITEASQMRQWFFDNIPEFEAKVGFETRFLVKAPSNDFLHIWKVTEVKPLKTLTYTWEFEGFEGNSYTTWELFDEGESTRLKLTAIVTESYPQNIPEFKRESGVAGWNYFLGQALKAYLS